MDSGLIPEAPYGLWVSEVINVRAVRALIDSPSWNDATKDLRSEFSGFNRRATDVWNALQKFQVPEIYRMQALLHPPVSDSQGGPVILTLCNAYKWFVKFGAIISAHPPCLDWQGGDIDFTRANVTKILQEAEAAVELLSYNPVVPAFDGDAAGGLTWDTTGRGRRLDLKYLDTLIREVVYPSGLPDSGQIVIDPAQFNQLLYGDAICGIDNQVTDVYVGYPYLTGSVQGLVYRRGFTDPKDPVMLGGLKENWAVLVKSGVIANQRWYGAFLPLVDRANLIYGRVWQLYSRNSGWTESLPNTNFDDADALRAWMESGAPEADHQWNEMLFANQDTLPYHGPAGSKTYGFHMPFAVVGDIHRSALCSAWRLPYVR
jgi:hypothetical protein